MEHLHEQIEHIRHQVEDLMDKHEAPAAHHLVEEIHNLEYDLRAGKNHYDLEDRTKRIIHILEGEGKADRIMNYEHLEMFKKQFEHYRELFKK